LICPNLCPQTTSDEIRRMLPRNLVDICAEYAMIESAL
jgi:hypothetical protein